MKKVYHPSIHLLLLQRSLNTLDENIQESSFRILSSKRNSSNYILADSFSLMTLPFFLNIFIKFKHNSNVEDYLKIEDEPIILFKVKSERDNLK